MSKKASADTTNGVVGGHKSSQNMKFPENMDDDLKDVNIKINDSTIEVGSVICINIIKERVCTRPL